VPRRIRLKIAIIESERTQRNVAEALRIPETRLSHIIAGVARPRTSEEIGLSELLRRPRDWLFGEQSRHGAVLPSSFDALRDRLPEHEATTT
jgi:hypothetical protein